MSVSRREAGGQTDESRGQLTSEAPKASRVVMQSSGV
jgi:hypothetical protein